MDKLTEQRLIKQFKKGTKLLVQEVNSEKETRYIVSLKEDAQILLGGWSYINDINTNIVRVICLASNYVKYPIFEVKLTNISSDDISVRFMTNNEVKYKYLIFKYESVYSIKLKGIVDSRYYIYQQTKTNYKGLNVGDRICTRYVKSNGDIEYGIAVVTELSNDANLEECNIFAGDINKWN